MKIIEKYEKTSIAIDGIHGLTILPTTCPTCGCFLTAPQQVDFSVKTSDRKMSKRIETSAIYCKPCNKWLLTKLTYRSLRKKITPYCIEFIQIPGLKQKKAQNHMPRQVANTNEQGLEGEIQKKKRRFRQSPYNKYGVFTYSNASKKWSGYSEE